MAELLRIPIDLLTTGPNWRKAVTAGVLIAIVILIIVMVTRKESFDNKFTCYDGQNKVMKCKSSSSLKSCDEIYKTQSVEECQQFADSTDFDKIAGMYVSQDGIMIKVTFEPTFFRGDLSGDFNDPKIKGIMQTKFNRPFNLYKLTSIDNRMCFGGYIPTIKESNENRVYFFLDGELKIDCLGKSFYKK